MAKWKLFSWKTLSIFLTLILIPFITDLIVDYVVQLRTRDRVEITLKLDGWITVGALLESDLQNLKLMYNNKPVKNILKISWRVVNTGSKGISKFEKNPSIVYPGKFDIAEVIISQTSPSLKIDKNLSINSEKRTIEVNNIGIFNPKDFFKIDMYIMDIPDSRIPVDFFTNWDLKAKSLDLQLKKDVTFEIPKEKSAIPWRKIIRIYLYMVIVAFVLRFIRYLIMKREDNRVKRELFK